MVEKAKALHGIFIHQIDSIMKLRCGFVSNSSSSSFALIGKEITVNELENMVKEDISIINNIQCIGEYLCEGQDVFPLTKEMYDWLMQYSHRDSLQLIHVFAEGSHVKKSDIPYEEFDVFSGEADYHYTEDLETFIERYEDKD
jgi:hypothetical protein